MDNPQKDNFHNFVFGIDKRYIRCIFESTIQIKPFLSKGGGGWRKTFKTSFWNYFDKNSQSDLQFYL